MDACVQIIDLGRIRSHEKVIQARVVELHHNAKLGRIVCIGGHEILLDQRQRDVEARIIIAAAGIAARGIAAEKRASQLIITSGAVQSDQP